ncbi:MAG TPA: hypothetical protein VLJ16_08290 [Acidobacteriota bacterium]|nr:hypothetical protein [Acidobacteriota bacterium]
MSRLAAAIVLAGCLPLSGWCLRGIIRRYRTLLGFPWLLSLAFAAAAIAAVLALHALLEP